MPHSLFDPRPEREHPQPIFSTLLAEAGSAGVGRQGRLSAEVAVEHACHLLAPICDRLNHARTCWDAPGERC